MADEMKSGVEAGVPVDRGAAPSLHPGKARPGLALGSSVCCGFHLPSDSLNDREFEV